MKATERPPTVAPPRLATTAEAPLVTRILVDAFAEDLMWGPWAFPDPVTRRQRREAVFGLLVQGALRYSHVWVTADLAAAAIWIPPGGTELTATQEEQIDAVLRTSVSDRADEVLAAFELLEDARPSDPHFYLTLLGTDPRRAGRGIGRRLLEANLDALDHQGAATYLEASDELVTFYERSGYRVISHLTLPGGPTVNGMWRAPGTRRPE